MWLGHFSFTKRLKEACAALFKNARLWKAVRLIRALMVYLWWSWGRVAVRKEILNQLDILHILSVTSYFYLMLLVYKHIMIPHLSVMYACAHSAELFCAIKRITKKVTSSWINKSIFYANIVRKVKFQPDSKLNASLCGNEHLYREGATHLETKSEEGGQTTAMSLVPLLCHSTVRAVPFMGMHHYNPSRHCRAREKAKLGEFDPWFILRPLSMRPWTHNSQRACGLCCSLL